jgi:hypothetical protein
MPDSQSQSESLLPEINAMTVWPSIAAFPLGRKVGQLCSISAGVGKFFTVGKLMALVTIPVTLVLYFWRLAPGVARRYVLTNRRIVIQNGLGGVDAEAIGLEEFDSIAVETLTGQEFLRAGDLVFLASGKEVFRLPGVQHPQGFRHACLRGQAALASVRQVVDSQSRQAEAAAAGSQP